jgi:Holliday junction resolvasome RuvABC DNA-binding subunit
MELKGKLVEETTKETSYLGPRASDIEEALRSLGYAQSEIREALEGVTLPEDESSALRSALQHLGRR